MAKVTRVFPYVDGRQIFTMPGGYGSSVIYHCWGGGGGAADAPDVAITAADVTNVGDDAVLKLQNRKAVGDDAAAAEEEE